MGLSLKYRRNLIPYLIVFFIVTVFFILASTHPHQMTSDVAFQIKSALQRAKGESKLFNTVVLPRPEDISQNIEAWILFWTPPIPVLFSLLIALGLPLGIATRLIAYILFILGCLGWIKLADTIKANFSTKFVLSLVLPIYSLTIGGVSLFIGDVLPFGILPWLFLYTLYFSRILEAKEKPYIFVFFNACFVGFLLGLVYWLKYSAFEVSIGLLAYLIFTLLFFSQRYSLIRRLFLLFTCSSFMLIPVIMLLLLNWHFTGMDYFTTLKIAYPNGCEGFVPYSSPFYKKAIYLFCYLLAAPGLALFQSSLWLAHIIHFSDRLFPVFSSLGFFQRRIPFALSGIPGTILIIWLLFYAKKYLPKMIFIFVCCVTFIPFLSLAYPALKAGGENLISENYRYTSAFFIFTEIILIDSFSRFILRNRKAIINFLAIFIVLIFFIVPNIFPLLYFIKNDIMEKIGQRYIATENHIFEPLLSRLNVKLVVERIESLIKSPKDIVVLSVIDSSGTSFVPWLEIKQRALPLGYFVAPLAHTHGFEGVNLNGLKPFKTSQELRVILVISKTLENDGKTLARIRQRFLQAKAWFRLADTAESDNLVSIWYADLVL